LVEAKTYVACEALAKRNIFAGLKEPIGLAAKREQPQGVCLMLQREITANGWSIP